MPSTPPHDETHLIAPGPPAKDDAASESTERPCFLLRNARTGRRSKFTAEDDLILLRKVSAGRAYVAQNGETSGRFDVVASKSNASREMSFSVTWKIAQVCCMTLKPHADDADKRKELMSGIDGDAGDVIVLLTAMCEARNDIRWCDD